MGGRYYGAREARFETKASKESRTDGGNRRGVFGDGGRRIRRDRADSKSTVASYRPAP
jgi:hypothetical protein